MCQRIWDAIVSMKTLSDGSVRGQAVGFVRTIEGDGRMAAHYWLMQLPK
jgi:hypothetical protein